MGDLGLILCLAPLVQEVIFSIKQVSSHFDVIWPLKSASKVKLYSLPRWGIMQPGKRLFFAAIQLDVQKGKANECSTN